jgi:NAD(P)-dependent dehydrogenase (short-subunit alcohol dehydrogenase family)
MKKGSEAPMDTEKLMFRTGLMSGERILVTGGGTGLGKEMAEAFLALGATVYILGRRGAVLEETRDELMGRHGGKLVALPCPFTRSGLSAPLPRFGHGQSQHCASGAASSTCPSPWLTPRL